MSDKQKQARLKKFLEVTKDIESSGGKNFNHQVMKSGVHAGHRAIGSYGIMPNTIKEFANRLPNPELKELSALSPEEMTARLEADPELESRVVEPIAGWMLDKYKDPRIANYAYQHGHNLPEERIKKQMEGSDRDNKFLERYQEPVVISEDPVIQEPSYFDKLKSFFSKP